MQQGYRTTTGTGVADNTTADRIIIAAGSASEYLRVVDATITVYVAAAGGGGEVALEDGVGGTRFFVADADAVGVHKIHFDPPGYPLSAATLLNLTVDSAVTTQATARATAIAIFAGG